MSDHTTTGTTLTVIMDAAQCDSIRRVLDEAKRVAKALGDYAWAEDTQVMTYRLGSLGTALAEAGLHCYALFHVEEALETAHLELADLFAAHGMPVEATQAQDDHEPGSHAPQAPGPSATLDLEPAEEPTGLPFPPTVGPDADPPPAENTDESPYLSCQPTTWACWARVDLEHGILLELPPSAAEAILHSLTARAEREPLSTTAARLLGEMREALTVLVQAESCADDPFAEVQAESWVDDPFAQVVISVPWPWVKEPIAPGA